MLTHSTESYANLSICIQDRSSRGINEQLLRDMSDATYTNNSFIGDDGGKRYVHFQIVRFNHRAHTVSRVIYLNFSSFFWGFLQFDCAFFSVLCFFFVVVFVIIAAVIAYSNGKESYDRQKPVELQTKSPNGVQAADDYEPYAHRKVLHPLT